MALKMVYNTVEDVVNVINDSIDLTGTIYTLKENHGR